MDPIPYTDLSYQAYTRIKSMILSGELPPGEKILQEKIASRLGVSRMPLHKAFQMLEDELLVESVPRRGIFVRRPDLRDIIEAFECREGLEGVAARRIVETMSDEQIDELEGLFAPFRDLDRVDEARYQQADQSFHEAIIRASGNSILQKLNAIGSVLIRTYPKGIILPFEDSMNDHRLIIRALRERDPEKAEGVLRNHSRKARDILMNQLQNSNNQ